MAWGPISTNILKFREASSCTAEEKSTASRTLFHQYSPVSASPGKGRPVTVETKSADVSREGSKPSSAQAKKSRTLSILRLWKA